ncbi:hypothetical protein SAMN02746098_00651 [Desulfosporosinus lacus DSM 15449]|uniref:Uncharacterized protein n=2 Tax=Desulfosporosinus TaxID=79206 RepID=A0A1M5RTE0_9FIRM|nr:hypothetical protein SAMN02746098_00651 [Desulfosporosinus lacus DSM 15449]
MSSTWILIYKRERLKRVANQTSRKAGSGDELETRTFPTGTEPRSPATILGSGDTRPSLAIGWRIAGNSSERTALSGNLVYVAYEANVVNQNPPRY